MVWCVVLCCAVLFVVESSRIRLDVSRRAASETPGRGRRRTLGLRSCISQQHHHLLSSLFTSSTSSSSVSSSSSNFNGNFNFNFLIHIE